MPGISQFIKQSNIQSTVILCGACHLCFSFFRRFTVLKRVATTLPPPAPIGIVTLPIIRHTVTVGQLRLPSMRRFRHSEKVMRRMDESSEVAEHLPARLFTRLNATLVHRLVPKLAVESAVLPQRVSRQWRLSPIRPSQRGEAKKRQRSRQTTRTWGTRTSRRPPSITQRQVL